MIIEIPEELRELQKPWLPDIDEKHQWCLRTGADVTYDGGRYRIGAWLSGGAGTAIALPVDKDTYEKYLAIKNAEFF